MRSKTDWLDAGLREITAGGPPGLRLEVLCAAMHATRGSFYHHFSDIGSYRRELAAYFEELRTGRYIEVAERVGAADPQARLEALRATVFDNMTSEGTLLERAFRAWATQESYVAEVMARVDKRRLDYLASLLEEAGADDARERAETVYLIVVGGVHVTPPLPPERMSALISRALAGAFPAS